MLDYSNTKHVLFFAVPLAKKLKECGVFGVSSDEYLNYAETNRKEWELRGQAVVEEMAAKYLPSLEEGDEEDLSLSGEDTTEDCGTFDDTSALVIEEAVIFNVTDSWEILRRVPDYEETAGTILFQQ